MARMRRLSPEESRELIEAAGGTAWVAMFLNMTTQNVFLYKRRGLPLAVAGVLRRRIEKGDIVQRPAFPMSGKPIIPTS